MAALTHIYKGFDGDWENLNNWSTGRLPGEGEVGDRLTVGDKVILPASVRTKLTTNLDRSTKGSYASRSTLTFTDNADDSETITLDAKTYTFQLTLTDADGNVLIGSTASDSIDNLIAAITLGDGAGTAYAASTTLHPTMTAETGDGDTMVAKMKTLGTAGDGTTTTETITDAFFDGAVTSGGVDGLTLYTLEVEDGYEPDIGSSGIGGLSLSAFGIRHRGSGQFNYRAGAGSGVGRFIVDPPFVPGGGPGPPSPRIALRTSTGGASQTIVVLEMLGGSAFMDSRVGILWMSGDSNTVTQGPNSSVWDVAMSTGTLFARNLDQVYMTSSAKIINGFASSPSILVQMGGRFSQEGDGTITDAYILDGVFDTTNTPSPKKVNALYLFPNATALIDPNRDENINKTVIGE